MLLIPQLVKIFRICVNDRKTQKENQIFSENNKNKLHRAQFTDKTFDNILWFFVNIAGFQHTKANLLNHDVHELLLSILTVEDNRTNKIIWKILGDFLSSDDVKTQLVVNAGILDSIISYLYRDFLTFDFSVLKEVAYATSNIATGTISQIKNLIGKGIFKRVWELVKIFEECDFNDPKQINNHKLDAVKV